MVGRKRGQSVAAVLAACWMLAPALGAQIPRAVYNGLHWRLVGPFRGGRVEAVAGIPGNPNEYYFGAVGGGVWKTTDGGLQWKPIFDQEPVQSIGAIAIDPSNSNILYVGTGESALRDDIDTGDGVYKSVDAGRTWTQIGLQDTRQISKILVDPKQPNIVFVAAMGHAFGPNTERGVFRSTDGGQTWTKVLYVDENTGAGDLIFDPNHPQILYAAMYQARRSPWMMTSGGPGSGLYKSADGGATWHRLEGGGLPTGILGKIGIAVSPADSNRIYAMIEGVKNALYRSDDAGRTWQMTNDDSIWVRPWYGNVVEADPHDANRVYLLDLNVYRSEDGGKTFRQLPAAHTDEHSMWIDPTNPLRMIVGNDGGATISTDGGESWSRQDNQPTAQFYHVATDNEFNYRLYGSQQDSGTVAIRSRSDSGSITDRDWKSVGGGESGYVLVDPRDPEIVYGGDHNAHITRYDGHTGQVQIISPWLGMRAQVPAGLKYRFNWTPAMALSPQNPDVLYAGANVLFKSTDGGMSWKVISPDLTRDDKSKQQSSPGPLTPDNSSAEYYDTIFSVAESPVQPGVLWVGSDDGLVHVSRDGGGHWENVTPKDMPAWTRVNLIEPSHFAAGTAYVVGNRHMLDDFRPMIYKTTDFGQTWTEITNGIPTGESVESVREDPARRGLLFAGTDLGVYVSFDDGAHWQSLQLNLPHVPVYDLTVHRGDLAVATHGRAFWILDDISPLRQATAEIAAEPAHLFTPEPAYREHGGGGFGGPGRFASGQNPPQGAILDYYLAAKPSGPVALEILDSSGQTVRRFSSTAEGAGGRARGRAAGRRGGGELPAEAGLNRFVWNLREAGAPPVPGLVLLEIRGGAGPLVLPGSYRVKLTVEGQSYTAPLEVKLDPRVHVSQGAIEEQFTFAKQIYQRIDELNGVLRQMRATRAALETKRRGANGAAGEAIEGTEKKLEAIRSQIVQVHSTTLGASLVYPIELYEQYADLANTVESADSAPPAQTREVYQSYEARRERLMSAWKALENEISSIDKQ